MKIRGYSLYKIFLSFALLLLQIGCHSPDKKRWINLQLNHANAMWKQARFLRHEGDMDSAISYYKKSLSLFKVLEKQNDPNDTIYKRKIGRINFYIGYIYDSLNNFDSALVYYLESLKRAKLSDDLKLQLGDELLIGCLYYYRGTDKEQGSAERKTLYSRGIIYLKTNFRASDSLGKVKNKYTLEEYYMLLAMYKETGDSSNARFVNKQYNDLYLKLKSQNPLE